MATNLGTAVVFGYTGTNGIVITGISGTLLQSAEHSAEADREDIRDGDGDIVAHNFHDQNRKATLEWVVTGTGLANAIVNRTLASLVPGTIIAIATCASDPDLVASTWVIMSARSVGSNTTSARISVQIEKRAGVTAAASA